MELHQVRYFLALTRTLNFTRAADQCHVTQPALTKAIQKLEIELGGELVYRERHLTQLTDLGVVVLPMLERVFAAAQSARDKAMAYHDKEIAILRVGLSPSVSPSILVNPITELSLAIRGLEIEIVELEDNSLSEGLLEGDVHAAIAGGGQTEAPRIDHWKLFEEPYLALMTATHPLARSPTITLSDLRRSTLLERSTFGVSENFLRRHPQCGANWRTVYRGRQESHLQSMAAAGLGILLAPEHLPRLHQLVARPIEGDPIRRSVELFVMAGRCYSPALNAFIKISRLHDWGAVPAWALQAPEPAMGEGRETATTRQLCEA